MVATGNYGLQTSPRRLSEEGSGTEASSPTAHFPSSLHPILTPGAGFCCVQEPSHTPKVMPPPKQLPWLPLRGKLQKPRGARRVAWSQVVTLLSWARGQKQAWCPLGSVQDCDPLSSPSPRSCSHGQTRSCLGQWVRGAAEVSQWEWTHPGST